MGRKIGRKKCIGSTGMARIGYDWLIMAYGKT